MTDAGVSEPELTKRDAAVAETTSEFLGRNGLRIEEVDFAPGELLFSGFALPPPSLTAEAVGFQCEEALPFSTFYEVILDGQVIARCTHKPVHTIVLREAA